MSINIRNADIIDLDSIYIIELECFTDESFHKELFKKFLASPEYIILIAEIAGKPIGFIMGSIERLGKDVVGHISTLDVKQKYRRKGIGLHLLTALERKLVEKGARTCYLEVRINNIAAQNLYLKHGYIPIENLRDYYGLGANGIRFKKYIKKK